ncbi:MAG TPA: hypothetical protein VL221_10095 [Bacteroidota bacterium]|nr:hypothetical protein [Bacteroidota bacterium]
MTMLARGCRAALALFVGALVAPRALEAQDAFGSLSSAHFDVRYQRGVPQEDARIVLEILQEQYKSLAADLGLEPSARTEVHIYESVGKFLEETPLKRPWRVAYYQRGILHVQPLSAVTQRKAFEHAVGYEMALAFLDASMLKGCPRWLAESFASYYSGETAGMTPPLGERLTAFSDLNQDIQEFPNPPQRDDVHYILSSTMAYFVQKYGEKRAFRLYREFDGATSVERVFKKVFEDEYPAIEKGWAKYIASRTASFK